MDENGLLGKRSIASSDGRSIEITIYVPRTDANGSFFCEFSLNGFCFKGKKRSAFGIDAIQSLYLALQSIGSDLEALQERGDYHLSWVGGSHEGDFGLPTIAASVY